MDTDLPQAAPRRTRRNAAHAAALLTLLAAALGCAGCSPRGDTNPAAATVTPTNVRLTEAQRQSIHLHTVEPAQFRRMVEVNGVVDFDNDQATSVLAPFSGPVSRLLVSPGDSVKQGQPLAAVDSPDFAAAVSAYRKALATAQTDRRIADQDRDLLQHKGVSQREAEQAQTDASNAEADRDAALRALVSLNVPPQVIRDIEAGRVTEHSERADPLAGHRNGGGETHYAG